jgi:hypothetical protein
VRDWFRKAIAIIKDLAPYAAIELILPGGSVIAVLLWLYRRSKLVTGAAGKITAKGQVIYAPESS